MLDAAETFIVQQLVDHYPDWWATKHIVAIGKRIVQLRADYRFDKRLILTKHPTIIHRIRAGYTYARYQTLQGHNTLIETSADALFVHCYFIHKKEATAFSSAIHFPRYFFALIKRTWQEVSSLVFNRTDHGTSTYLLMAIVLEVAFHNEIGDWINTEDLIIADDELSQP